VWFGRSDGHVYVRSEADAAKVKRIRNDPRVRVAPCTARGKPLGPPAEGRARVLGEPGDIERAEAALEANYGLGRKFYERVGEALGTETVYLHVTEASAEVPALRATAEQIRETAAPDREALARSLADAFMDDPVARWSAPRDSLRWTCLRRFFGAYLSIRVPMGLVWNDSALAGVAIWAPPGRGVTTTPEALRLMSAFGHPGLWPRGPLVGYGLLSVEHLHPKSPDHLYLATLGVKPSEQGRGLGSLLLGPALELCDRDGLAAYLEASKESNIAFYARHGFRVTREIKLPRGPTMYAMWREPRR
jgi:PPOX class probable F420-dependent enzyme